MALPTEASAGFPVRRYTAAWLCLALLFLTSGPFSLASSPVEVPEGNLERLEECARRLCDSILLSYRGQPYVCVQVAEHEAAWLLDRALLGAAERNGIEVRSCPEPALTLAITSIGLQYGRLEDEDILLRTATFSVSATRQATAGSGSPSVRSNRSYHTDMADTIYRDQASLLENSGYSFTQGTTPPGAGPGFWEKIVEPLVVIGAAVVIVVLLFSTRSE